MDQIIDELIKLSPVIALLCLYIWHQEKKNNQFVAEYKEEVREDKLAMKEDIRIMKNEAREERTIFINTVNNLTDTFSNTINRIETLETKVEQIDAKIDIIADEIKK